MCVPLLNFFFFKFKGDSVSASDWEEIAKGHIEICNALKSMEPSQAILQFLDPFLARANIAFGHSGIANGAHDQTNVHSSVSVTHFLHLCARESVVKF